MTRPSLLLTLLTTLLTVACGPDDDVTSTPSDVGDDAADTFLADVGDTSLPDTDTADTETDTVLDTSATPDTDTGPPFELPIAPAPTIPTAGCGLDHTWAAMDRMGHLVEVEHQRVLSMDARVVRSLVESSVPTPGLSDRVLYGVDTYLVRYVTQDRGEEVEATGWVTLPHIEDTPAPDEGFPAVLMLHGSTGMIDACAPTTDGLEGAALPMMLAAMGFAVTAPDYLGLAGFGAPSDMLHPSLVPEPTAVASLDSVRALLWMQAEQTDLMIRNDVVIWGGSEGGFAALWSDRYAPHYAPELAIAGTIALVPPTNLNPMMTQSVETFLEASLVHADTLVSHAAWYRTDAPLSEVLTDDAPLFVASELGDALRAECRPGLLGDATAVEDLFTPAWITALTTGGRIDPWSCFFDQTDLAASVIPRAHDAPVLIQVAEEDELVVADAIRGDVPRLCDAGYAVEYIECAGADHTSSLTQTIPFQIDWATARLLGEPLAPTRVCEIGAPQDCTLPID